MKVQPIVPVVPVRNDASTDSDKRQSAQTLLLNDYCTGEPLEIQTDAVQHVITSRIGTMVYSTIVCKNGHRIGVEQKEEYIKNRLASA